jgi:hypothetical protein
MVNTVAIFIENFTPFIPHLRPPKAGVLGEPCFFAIPGRFAKCHKELVCFRVPNITVATDNPVSKRVVTPNRLELRHFDPSK